MNIDRWCSIIGVAIQDALAASLLAPCGERLVLDQKADAAPEWDHLLDGRRWATELLEPEPAFD